jgi:UDP-N-acetylglucosamine 2-epimerase (non-hydrolysing)
MARRKILSIFGSRAEAMKMAPVVKALESRPNEFESVVCITAQQGEALDQVLSMFRIKPHIDLSLARESQSFSQLMAQALMTFEQMFRKVKPDWVLVQGDTTSAMAASLAAFYNGVSIGHIEAGLRTYDKNSPFPEEVNRRVTSVVADLHFAPTKAAKENLVREGVEEKRVFVTGNMILDALFMIIGKQSLPQVQEEMNRYFLKNFGITFASNKRKILVTGQRRDSFSKDFENMCQGLKDIARFVDDVEIVYPVQLSPNVLGPVKRILGNTDNICLIPPLDYELFVYLVSNCYLLMTDSGDVQEEAALLGKPVLVMREASERPAAVDPETVRLVGTDKNQILYEAQLVLTNSQIYMSMCKAPNPNGVGKATQNILKLLSQS